MTLAALLEELKEVDPKLYDDISHLELIGWARPHNQAMDHLQGSIQRACERREWDLKQFQRVIKCDGPNEHHYYAEIDKGIAGTHEPIGYEGWGKSPTEALLMAYIAAVRASQ